ncbi:MAG: hypothetical protein V4650_16100 [Pseudomonadota bacterium]
MNPQDLHRVSLEAPPVEGLDSLLRERQPGRDLWAGIEARITPAVAVRRSTPVWPYALAASACLAVFVGVLLRQPSPRPDDVALAQQSSSAFEVATAAEGGSFNNHPYSNGDRPSPTAALSPRTLRMLRSESLDNAPALVAERAEASGLMKATYAAGSGRNSHGQQAILRANLKLVAQAEREVRRALLSDPNSASLQSLLNVAQEKRAVLTSLLVHDPD